MNNLKLHFYDYTDWYSDTEGARFISKRYQKLFEVELNGIKMFASVIYKEEHRTEYDDGRVNERSEEYDHPTVNFFMPKEGITPKDMLPYLTQDMPYEIIEDNTI